MKAINLIVILLIFTGIVDAQDYNEPRNTFRAGLNGAFFSSGDIFGIGLRGESVSAIPDFLAITPRIMVTIGNDNYDLNQDLFENIVPLRLQEQYQKHIL